MLGLRKAPKPNSDSASQPAKFDVFFAQDDSIEKKEGLKIS